MRKSILIFASLGLFLCASCAPPGQRIFDPNAGRPPQPPSVPVKAAKPPPEPFIRVFSGTPRTEWQPVVKHAAQIALQRKATTYFEVSLVAPGSRDVETDVDRLRALIRQDGRDMLHALAQAGVPSDQLLLTARIDPEVKRAFIRIDLR